MHTQSIPVTKVIVRLAKGEETFVAVSNDSGSAGYDWRVEPGSPITVTREVYTPVPVKDHASLLPSVLHVFTLRLEQELTGEWIERIELISPALGETIRVIEAHIGAVHYG
ncbi:hypothetical protein [Paenibacillus sp. PDC88]|uniref:hypothetical protein n=1 Tax=Paenibacillus sp. PDC88 TaxID=1884375 RepID=UPI000899ABB2|nr:hypothetical protein [Paenibacillus sp. PDC88]SDW71761.1 hypothetical protein SAMN05518848_102792 [Paenibacillus sp. PDC88]